jgi:hypothetical protein
MIKIIHPYGQVGHLPWRTRTGATPFGEEVGADRLLSLVGQIKTFTEQIENHFLVAETRGLLQKAQAIVFLGFGFHRQNLELMRPSEKTGIKRIFATAKGISNSDCDVVQGQITNTVQTSWPDLRIRLRNELTCHELLGEYRRSLDLAD